jgi:REP element-mobilizing transposase RayT
MTDPPHYGRRSLRLPGFDYSSAGAYYVTICTHYRVCAFGEVRGEAMVPSDLGRAIERIWQELPSRFPGVDLDAFVVMPNHIHGILFLNVGAADPRERGSDSNPTSPGPCSVGAPLAGALHSAHAPASLGTVIGAFKSLTARAAILAAKASGNPSLYPLWQRNYYEHVVRGEEDLARFRAYIADNPARWGEDEENPSRDVKH